MDQPDNYDERVPHDPLHRHYRWKAKDMILPTLLGWLTGVLIAIVILVLTGQLGC